MMLMTLLADTWWTGEQAGWIGGIGGSVLGILGGLIGTACGVLAPRGKGRLLVLGTMSTVAIISFMIVVIGLVALVIGQPFMVWYPCLLTGFLGTVIFGGLIPVVRSVYRQAERRQLEAQSLRGA